MLLEVVRIFTRAFPFSKREDMITRQQWFGLVNPNDHALTLLDLSLDVLQLSHVYSCLLWTRRVIDLFVAEESLEYHVVVHLRDVLGETVVLLEESQ